MPKIQNILTVLKRRNQPIMFAAVRNWLQFAEQQIQRDLTRKFIKAVSRVVTEFTDWELIEANGIETIKPAGVQIMQSGGDAGYRHLAVKGSFDVINVHAVNAVNKFTKNLVTEVTKGTKEGINLYIKEGIKQGHSMTKIAKELRPLVGLTENQTQSIINYRTLLEHRRPGLPKSKVDKAVLRYTNKTHRMRLEMIARTETANAQNIGYCQGLGQVGIKQAELINGTNPCDVCIALNGKKWPIQEAEGIIAVHPRCTCAMLPVINDRVISERLKNPPLGLAVAKQKVESEIEPIDPPDENITLKLYLNETMSQKFAMKISQGLRETYPKKINTKNFGEMESAVLTYDSARTLAFVDKQIVGAISFHYAEVSEVICIDHIGTLMSPKGTGAELVRTAVDAAYAGRWGIFLESKYEAMPFWIRLGFEQNKKVSYVFEADFKRVVQIRKALGVIGRMKTESGVLKCV